MEDKKRRAIVIQHFTRDGDDSIEAAPSVTKHALTPPTSVDMEKRERSSSELSDIKDEEEEIVPDHYYDGGKIPVFKPTMDQFRSFKKFIEKVDKYGMRSGIIKVVPPREWRDSLPALDEAVKSIKVKNPITQEFGGAHGKYTQANIEKQRSYNLPQWKALTEESNHQPPAKRGERRRNQEVVTRGRSTRSQTTPRVSSAAKRKPGRPRKAQAPKELVITELNDITNDNFAVGQVPPTPTSTKSDSGKKIDIEGSLGTPTKSRGRQPKSVSSRRKHNRREAAEEVDEEAFKDFNYRFSGLDDFTPERCQELEVAYWKSLTFAPPMYGADMPGSLFDDRTTSWNVAKLENLLDVLGTKVPGVNTAYLYLGMWKATFAWHLEDVDLYSINYIHFGAPKQWYSISQEDARRFEAAMKSIWTSDAKNCDQFLRHKTYLISPQLLQSQFNIRVNKLVHNEGEFVITFPYGYHSGYNLGYNCAESVNFATEAWLDYGRIAKKCDCEADSVWVDVAEIERKLRGEDLQEFYEDSDEENDDLPNDLPSPPSSLRGEANRARKRKRQIQQKVGSEHKTKRVKIRIKVPTLEPCVLCPNVAAFDTLLPTDNGKKAHRLCALYTPETYLTEDGGYEKVCNVSGVDKARLDLKCNFCRSKRGACFQCAQRKCTRSFHATCAAAAGVQVDTGLVPTFDEDGTEYACEGYDFRCRYHRPRRLKTVTVETLENNTLLFNHARSLRKNDIVQIQYIQGDIFGGVVVENRASEHAMLIDVLPDGDRVEIDWKYICYLDPAESQRPKPSANAKSLPQHLNNKKSINPNNRQDAIPTMEEPFADPDAIQKWAEFNTGPVSGSAVCPKVDLFKEDQLWFYLGHISTEARAKFSEDPTIKRHNIKSNFLDTVKPPHPPLPFQGQRRSYPASYPRGANVNAINGAMVAQRQKWKAQQSPSQRSSEPLLGQRSKPIANQAYDRSITPARWSQEDRSKEQDAKAVIDDVYSRSSSVYSGVTTNASSYSYQAPNQMSGASGRTRNAIDRASTHNTATCTSPTFTAPLTRQIPYAAGAYPTTGYRQGQSDNSTQATPADRVRNVAPVARMMGSSNSHPNVVDRALPEYSKEAQEAISISQTEYLSYIQQFPYLRNSYLRRPKSYESPYAPANGISTKYLKYLLQQQEPEAQHEYKASAPQKTTLNLSSTTGKPELCPPNGCIDRSSSEFRNDDVAAQNDNTPNRWQKADYQTGEQFRKQVSHDNESVDNTSKMEKLIAQLSRGVDRLQGGNVDESSSYKWGSEGPLSRAVTASFKAPEGGPMMTIPSPVRPVASPISDAGCAENSERSGI